MCDTCKKNGTDERKGIVRSEKVRNRKEEVQKKKLNIHNNKKQKEHAPWSLPVVWGRFETHALPQQSYQRTTIHFCFPGCWM